ncbi:MAG: hypothetical protein M1821_006118 [Bathelium mastoideum]|nr:MAG: hypothetical protein M1821_006118 [Bathelium mastoideum]KAI9688349.1 MAG: hypothetical protein M1822_001298 [Bathelium mastoideum]
MPESEGWTHLGLLDACLKTPYSCLAVHEPAAERAPERADGRPPFPTTRDAGLKPKARHRGSMQQLYILCLLLDPRAVVPGSSQYWYRRERQLGQPAQQNGRVRVPAEFILTPGRVS